MSDWYYAHNNEQKGPTNESEIKAFLATGQLPNTILVWKEGMDAWLPASQVPAFSFRPPPAPAKVQPAPVSSAPAPAAAATPAASTTATSLTSTDKPAVDVSDKVQSALNSITSEVGVAGDPEDVEKNRTFATIAYIPPLFFVPIFAAKDSPFAKYHANQGLLLTIAWFCVVFVSEVVIVVIANIMPFIVTELVSVLLNLILLVGIVGCMVLGIMSAQKGIMKPLPLIGKLAIIIK
jgi:uncharacterized membrane protein